MPPPFNSVFGPEAMIFAAAYQMAMAEAQSLDLND
jgi:hypothetical protein